MPPDGDDCCTPEWPCPDHDYDGFERYLDVWDGVPE